MRLSFKPARGKAFDAIYHATHGRLYNTFLKLAKDDALVKDILQQCYIRLWENWDNIPDKTDIYPLLFTYARNIFIDELRKIKARRVLLANMRADEAHGDNSHEHYVLKESMAAIQNIVQQMPARRREVYRLSQEEGLSRKNIADLLSLSPNTIDCHLQEALKTLRSVVNS